MLAVPTRGWTFDDCAYWTIMLSENMCCMDWAVSTFQRSSTSCTSTSCTSTFPVCTLCCQKGEVSKLLAWQWLLLLCAWVHSHTNCCKGCISFMARRKLLPDCLQFWWRCAEIAPFCGTERLWVPTKWIKYVTFAERKEVLILHLCVWDILHNGNVWQTSCTCKPLKVGQQSGIGDWPWFRVVNS